jgi:hypothetical protein
MQRLRPVDETGTGVGYGPENGHSLQPTARQPDQGPKPKRRATWVGLVRVYTALYAN